LHIAEHGSGDRFQVRPGHNRGQVLQPDGFAAAFHAAFVVTLTRAGKAGFEQVMADQRLEPIGQFPLLEPDDPFDRRRQVVVDQPPHHGPKERECPYMPVEETSSVAAVIEVYEVVTRVHRPQQELPGFAPLAVLVDEHFEEIHLGFVARTMDQRNVDLGRLSALFRHELPHRPLPDL